MEGEEDIVEVAALEGEDPGDARGAVEGWAWIAAEGVEEEVVGDQ